MSDRYVEKTFLYFIALSLLLHVGVYVLIISMPELKPPVRQEPIMIDLEDLPELPRVPMPAEANRQARRQSEEFRRVPREMAPKGMGERDRIPPPPPGCQTDAPGTFCPFCPGSFRTFSAGREQTSGRRGQERGAAGC